MITTYENKDKPLMENCFMEDDKFSVCGWYGLTYFEISDGINTININSKADFDNLYEMMTAMKKRVDTL